jgi:hypothetical protein
MAGSRPLAANVHSFFADTMIGLAFFRGNAGRARGGSSHEIALE